MVLSACENYSFLSSILLVKRIIELFCFLIPLALVVSASISIAKIILNPGMQMTKRDIKKISNKFIASALVFFVPLLVSLLMTMLDKTSVLETACWENANNEAIAVYRSKKEMEDDLEKQVRDSEHEEAEEIRKEIEEAREKTREENEKLSEEELKKYQVTGGSGTSSEGVVYYCQKDYDTSPYSTYGTIKSHGCGTTSAAIVASTLFKPEVYDPITTTSWICSHGGCYSSGTAWEGITKYLKSLGLEASTLYSWQDSYITKMNDALVAGDSLVIILTHHCIFTTGGHYLVITGIKDGEYTVADPWSREKTKKTWPRSTFAACSPTFTIYTKK